MATPQSLAPQNNSFEIIRSTMRSENTLARFSEVLGQHQAQAYIASVLIAVSNNSALMSCSPQSIVTSAMRAATLRLSCDPAIGQAHLVPFKNKATLVIGYKGIKDMAVRTGRYRYLNVAKIYEGQTVEEDQLKGTHFIKGYKTGNKVIGWLLYFELVSGFSKTFYMTVEEIHEHAQKYSKSYAYNDSPWKTNTAKMEMKTVLRLGLGTWGYFDPNDVSVMNAVDESDDDGVVDVVTEATPRPRRSEADILRDMGFEPEPDEVITEYKGKAISAMTDSELTAFAENKITPIEVKSAIDAEIGNRMAQVELFGADGKPVNGG